MGKTLEMEMNDLTIYDAKLQRHRPLTETEQADYAARQTAMRQVRIPHMTGCPQERIEQYTATNDRAQSFTVTRCQDCGEQSVQPKL